MRSRHIIFSYRFFIFFPEILYFSRILFGCSAALVMSKEKAREKRGRSPSQSPQESVGPDDIKRIMSEAMAAQLPRLILETTKVVTEQLGAEMRDRDDSSRSFTNFTQEMKQMKLRQEEISIQSKAAGLKSDGKILNN